MNLYYRDWEELEDEALEESQQTKKKPKKKKKSWKEVNTNEQIKRNKKEREKYKLCEALLGIPARHSIFTHVYSQEINLRWPLV